MLERGALLMGQVKVFVLDEADEMLKMGFQDDVEKIMEGLPEDRQMNLWCVCVCVCVCVHRFSRGSAYASVVCVVVLCVCVCVSISISIWIIYIYP
jgi:hypothetical protein